MLPIRFKLSIWIYWLWIKVTPGGKMKSAIINSGYAALCALRDGDYDEEWVTEIAATSNDTPAASACLAKGLDGGEG